MTVFGFHLRHQGIGYTVESDRVFASPSHLPIDNDGVPVFKRDAFHQFIHGSEGNFILLFQVILRHDDCLGKGDVLILASIKTPDRLLHCFLKKGILQKVGRAACPFA